MHTLYAHIIYIYIYTLYDTTYIYINTCMHAHVYIFCNTYNKMYSVYRYILPDAKCGLEFACCRASSIKGLIGSKGLWAEAIEVHPQIQHDCGILAHVSDPSTYVFWFQEGDVRDGLSFLLLLVFLLSLCYCFFLLLILLLFF